MVMVTYTAIHADQWQCQGRRHGGGKGDKRPPEKYLGGASPPLTPSSYIYILLNCQRLPYRLYLVLG